MWDVGTRQPRQVFNGQEGELRSLAISPDGRTVAAGARNGMILAWAVAAGKSIRAPKGHTADVWSLAFAPDGTTLVSGSGAWLQPGEVKVWETGSGRLTKTLKHTGEALCLAISPDGKIIAAGSWDRTIKIWKLDAAEQP